VRRVLPLFWLTALGCLGGDPPPQPGREGWACPNDNNCIAPLACVAGFCAVGVRDAGVPDTGVAPDTGVDAGVAVDAGDPPDTGVEDAGDPPDTGVDDAGAPDAGCDLAPRLSVIQARVFGANGSGPCNQAACHGAGVAGGIRLTAPLNDLHTVLLGPTRDPQAPQRVLVDPGNPDGSRLYVIMSRPNPGGSRGPMPPAPAPLVGVCELEALRTWITDGAAAN
jgi:hypothetical protein